MGKLFQELKRRNVIRVAVAYAIVAWLLIEVSATTFPMLRLPEWTATFVMVLLMIGFPVVLIFAWAFELTPEGLKKEKDVDRSQSITHVTGRKLDFVIIGVLIAALGYFAYDKFVLERSPDTDLVQAATEAKIGQDVEPGESETPDKSIAVLPFVNMSADPENEYFSDGLSEELLNLLAKVPELKVAARTSAFAFKGTNMDATEIARQLRVAHVLEGSVRQSGDRLRITAQLVDASHGYHLWSDTWERQLSDIFAIQDEIAGAVVESLRITLLDALPETQRTDPEAYALLSKSKGLPVRSSKEVDEERSHLLIQALAIDPDYAAAWAELAISQFNQAWRREVNSEEGFARAEASAQRALSLDPNNVRALIARGAIEMIGRWDFSAAGEWFSRAHEVAPGDAGPLNALAIWARSLGRLDDAHKLYQEAVDRDPLSITPLSNLASLNFALDRLDDVNSQIEAMKQINSEHIVISGMSAWLEWHLGNFEEALHYSDQMENPWVLRVCALHDLGRFTEAQTQLEELQRFDKPDSWTIANGYACMNEVDRAFEWLERAYQEHDPNLIKLLGNELNIRELHGDPRWNELAQKLGLSDEQVEKLWAEYYPRLRQFEC